MAVSDEEILNMQRRLAASGVWVEPASAAGLAGLAHELREGRIDMQGQARGGGLHRARTERPRHHRQKHASSPCALRQS